MAHIKQITIGTTDYDIHADRATNDKDGVALTNYLNKKHTNLHFIESGLVVGASETSASAKGQGRLIATGVPNPLFGLLSSGSTTPFYLQAYVENQQDVLALGPTSSVATLWDSSGNLKVQGNLTTTGTINGLRIKTMTLSAYNALPSKDSNTIYVITG